MPHRLFSWEHSLYSGKVRAYLRYKEQMGDLGDGFEDILATPEVMRGLLTPAMGSTVLRGVDGAACLLVTLVLHPCGC